MDKKIGLEAHEVDAILAKAIGYGKVADANLHRAVIAEVIEKNNERILQDILKLIQKD
jgi:hypothetical protein